MQVKRECNLAHWACHTPVYISIGPVLWNVNVERHSQFCTDFFSLRNKREGEREGENSSTSGKIKTFFPKTMIAYSRRMYVFFLLSKF